MLRWLAVLAVLATPALAEPLRPAETPPPDFAGQQYVDSKGCMFVRAGTAGEVLWIPRVSRRGEPLCGNPPSGRRAPVVGASDAKPEAPVAAAPADASDDPGGYFVAVGSYVVADHAAATEARLADLDYPAIRGRVQGKSGPLITVFAGPFDDAAAGKAALAALIAAGFSDAMLIRP